MVKIRSGVFETNSSSTHAICVHNADPLILPSYIYFGLEDLTDEYSDWDTIQRRANYLNTILYNVHSKTDYINIQRNITRMLKEHDVNCEWAKCSWGTDGFAPEYGFYDIKDTCSGVICKTIITDEQILLHYLFGKNSCIIMGYEDMFYDRLQEAKKMHPEGEEYKYYEESY